MIDLRKAAEMALKTLENPWNAKPEGVADAIEALRQALAQPEQEPVVYLDEGLGAFYWPNQYKKGVGFTPLYAAPPHRWSNVTDDCLMEEVRRRGFVIRDARITLTAPFTEEHKMFAYKKKWVGLTDEEIEECKINGGLPHAINWRLSVKVMEAKLKEKNK